MVARALPFEGHRNRTIRLWRCLAQSWVFAIVLNWIRAPSRKSMALLGLAFRCAAGYSLCFRGLPSGSTCTFDFVTVAPGTKNTGFSNSAS